MKINHLTTIIAILATLLFATACEEETAETTEETPTAETQPAEEEATEEAPAEEAPAAEAQPAQAEGEGAAGGSVCERAVTCCEAYVAAVSATTPGVTADTACAGVRQAGAAPGGDATCTAAIAGWRQSLTALQQTVPSSCAE